MPLKTSKMFSELQALETECAELKEQLEDVTLKHTQAKRSLGSKQEEVLDLEDKLAQAETKIRQLNRGKVEAEDKCENLSELLALEQAAVCDLKDKLHEAGNLSTTSSQEVAHLTAQLTEAQERSAKLQDKLQQQVWQHCMPCTSIAHKSNTTTNTNRTKH